MKKAFAVYGLKDNTDVKYNISVYEAKIKDEVLNIFKYREGAERLKDLLNEKGKRDNNSYYIREIELPEK